MDPILERFSATELDNVLHAINKYEGGDGFSVDEIQTNIWLHDKIAPPINDAIQAIMHHNNDLVTITKDSKMGKRFRPGPNFKEFLQTGGFKKRYDRLIADDRRRSEER